MPLALLGPAEAAFDRGLTRIAKCWKIVRADNTAYRFTEHNAELTVSDEVYTPVGGIDDSATRKEVGFEKSNVEIRGGITTGAINASDLRTGKFRNARISELLVDWRFPFPGPIRTRTWVIQEINFDDHRWFAQCVSLSGLLSRRIGRIFQRYCDFDLGDADCVFQLPLRTVNNLEVGTPDSVEPKRIFTVPIGVGGMPASIDSKTIADGFFDFGKVVWTGGANAGVTSDVKRYTEVGAVATIELQLEAPFDTTATDRFNISQGCGKTSAICDADFANIVHHGGQPFTPGGDRMRQRGPRA